MSKQRKSFPLRISQELFDELRKWSEQEMRSVNGQIEFLLKQAVQHRKRKARRSSEEGDDQKLE